MGVSFDYIFLKIFIMPRSTRGRTLRSSSIIKGSSGEEASADSDADMYDRLRASRTRSKSDSKQAATSKRNNSASNNQNKSRQSQKDLSPKENKKNVTKEKESKRRIRDDS